MPINDYLCLCGFIGTVHITLKYMSCNLMFLYNYINITKAFLQFT